MIAGPSLVVGSFWLGWAGEYEGVPWYVPALSGVLIGAGVILIFVSFLVRFLFSDVDLLLSDHANGLRFLLFCFCSG